MTRAVVSLGSNLNGPADQLASGVAAFGSAVVAVSGVYATPPWGPVAQDEFRNQTIVVSDDDTDAAGWWRICQAAEARAHRERLVRWGPRTLDADVIAVWTAQGESVISDDPQLTLPHPRAAERAFVLLPWAEIEPDAELPGAGRIAELLRSMDVSQIRRVSDGR